MLGDAISVPSCEDASRSEAREAGYQPVSVTVIMPIRNESGFIEKSLGAVLSQDYPNALMEVIVADGMSDDDTRMRIATLSERHPLIRVSVIDNPQKIAPTGLNLALARARGDVIVRVDGHTIIEPDYVRECVSALQRSGADNVGGRMNAVGQSDFSEAVSLATSSRFGVGGARFHYSDREEWVDTVYMGAWRRQVFDEIGTFDEEQVRNQDDEFNYRLRQNNGKILLSQKIKSRYFTRSSPYLLWRQYYQYGFWKVRVMQKHPGQIRVHQLLPATFAAALTVGALLSPFVAFVRWLFLLTVVAYVVANFTASILIARRPGFNWRIAPYLPLIFATLHLAYGFGFLAGLIKFAATGQLQPPRLREFAMRAMRFAS